jgi:cellulose synthase/poly-beta-1,6-N-acetylglucosamine synthase-like glycosyltransferase
MLYDVLVYLSAFIGLFAVSYFFLSFLFPEKEKLPEVKRENFPNVSIIIPAYNEEKTIKGTISSALDLDYPLEKLELIVINDGSKDKTLEEAKKIKDKRLRIYSKENGGKCTALNLGIEKSKGEIIVTMDGDTYAQRDVLGKVVPPFLNEKVMCVVPSMIVYKPKGILQRVQQIEYLMGVYLRKAFSTMNAVHVTPGAFSVYRKSFFEKYGGFESSTLTEDMEMSLRIQANNYIIYSAPEAIVHTNAPKKFIALLRQRRRWYFGMIENLWNYRRLFSKKYGELGLVVLPIAVTSTILPIILTLYFIFSSLSKIKKDLLILQSINFSFSSLFQINEFVIERFLFNTLSSPLFLFSVLFLIFLTLYMIFAKNRIKERLNIPWGLNLFLIFYSILFVFWWIISIFYIIFIGKISWGKK